MTREKFATFSEEKKGKHFDNIFATYTHCTHVTLGTLGKSRFRSELEWKSCTVLSKE